MRETKILLTEEEIPTCWYNIQADLPEPLPPLLHPATKEPTQLPPPLFCSALNEQEFTTERWIEIPEEVREVYRLWRPTPLYRAYRWEKALGTPAKIYYKWEGVSPPGSHKPNTAVAQAYYAKKAGIKRLTTETGAGQWGSALAFACRLFDMECKVYMVKVSYYQKPYRRVLMETWGAEVVPSPSEETKAGRDILAEDPDSPGSLGIAISEAVEEALNRDDTNYSLGSVVNHVLMHQTIIGLETMKQFEKIGEYPDIMIGCIGGGSSFAGFIMPFVREKILGKRQTRFIAVEPMACPSVTKGLYTYDFGDTAGLAPLIKMYTLGHSFVPPPIHAGGLRYHGMAPIICHLHRLGIIEAVAVHQNPVFSAAVSFAKAEGIIPAPEPSHAIKVTLDEALKCKETGEEKVIAFNLCGHGHFDMAAYDSFLTSELEDYEYPKEKVMEALKGLPKVGG
jgi:tryptophan synthase beta chain